MKFLQSEQSKLSFVISFLLQSWLWLLYAFLTLMHLWLFKRWCKQKFERVSFCFKSVSSNIWAVAMLNFAWYHFCNSKIDRNYLKLKRLLFHLGKDKYPRKCWAMKTILRYKLHPELIIRIHCQKHLPSLLTVLEVAAAVEISPGDC